MNERKETTLERTDAVAMLMKRLHEQLHDAEARTCLDDTSWNAIEQVLSSAFDAGELHAATQGDSYTTLLHYADQWKDFADSTNARNMRPHARLVYDAFIEAAREIKNLRRGGYDERPNAALNFFTGDDDADVRATD